MWPQTAAIVVCIAARVPKKMSMMTIMRTSEGSRGEVFI